MIQSDKHPNNFSTEESIFLRERKTIDPSETDNGSILLSIEIVVIIQKILVSDEVP
jgi:hypothetical protein